MGTVWLAHDQSLDRVCALKIVDPDKASNEEVRKRFLREARATAQIRSVNVVEVFEHGVWDGLPFIVMELLDGEDLGARLDRVGVLETETAHRIIAQIARGLARAHALGIVHRDLKPENVFLVPRDGEEIAKVLDFGIAHHAIYSPLDKATQAGAVMGTPCYMSPEQALGEHTDWRADLWELGVLAFQCLTGKLPFYHEAIGGLLTQILYEPIPSIRAANPALPKAVEDWWQRAAERDPEKRFQTAAELSDALAVALEVREPLAVPPLVPCSEALNVDPSEFEGGSDSVAEFAARVHSDAPVALDTGELITRFRRKVRRRSAWMWGLGVPLACLLVVLGGWLRGRLTASPWAGPPAGLALTPPSELLPASRGERAAAASRPVPVSELPPSPRPSVEPLEPSETDGGIPQAEQDPGVATPSNQHARGASEIWPSPRPPELPSDMPSLEKPSEQPQPKPRLPARARRPWHPGGSDGGSRDYGI